MRHKIPTTEIVKWQLRITPGVSCTVLCHLLNFLYAPRNFDAPAVSGILNRLTKQGVLTALPNLGPRGGNGYFLSDDADAISIGRGKITQ